MFQKSTKLLEESIYVNMCVCVFVCTHIKKALKYKISWANSIACCLKSPPMRQRPTPCPRRTSAPGPWRASNS